MPEPTIICPNCRKEIKLTESLAAPLLESARQEFEKRLHDKEVESAARDKSIREREEAVRRAQETIDAAVADKLRLGRAQIAAEEAKRAKLALAADLDTKNTELAALQTALKENTTKLAAAQKAQAELLVKQRELDDAKREMDLTIQKQVSDNLAAERDKARKDAEERLSLKVIEKEQTIAGMQKQIEELKRRSEQGSQQLQGEALEVQLESLLAAKFPLDKIVPVPKGAHGGDILHYVAGAGAAGVCGAILWEIKNTKSWSDIWLPKLRDDQRAAKADLAVIVSASLPKGIDTFDILDNIWITHPRCAIPVAMVLRSGLLEVAAARQSAAGQQTKAEEVYQYLTGTRFRLRVGAIVEAFRAMQDDLQQERKVLTARWNKRQTQLDRVLEATSGLYGDLQGIAGKPMQAIEGLEMKLLEANGNP